MKNDEIKKDLKEEDLMAVDGGKKMSSGLALLNKMATCPACKNNFVYVELKMEEHDGVTYMICPYCAKSYPYDNWDIYDRKR